MNGLPKQCSTRADYEYVKSAKIDGWDGLWRKLLEGRFSVQEGNLVEDANAPLFRLGFTVVEVEKAIGFSGMTDREIEWRTSHPDRYQLVNGEWLEIDGWAKKAHAAALFDALENKLAEVDTAVAKLQRGTFFYDGHQYYMDRDYISDQIAALPYLPDDYTREWKTAGKNGVENVYVVLDKAALVAMAMACLQQFNDNWAAGDTIKKSLKALYAQGTDVSTYEVVL